jgi:hypothetical protein
MISIIRYNSEDNEEITRKISEECDARIIWGGDKTINQIRKIPIKARTVDIPFPDRYSLCVINSNEILKLDKIKLNSLVNKFFNDTYIVDQNACSSPQLIYWTGNKNKEAKNIFCRYFWQPINTCNPYKKSFKGLKNSKDLQKKLIWLPSSLKMNKRDMLKVCNLINQFIKKNF